MGAEALSLFPCLAPSLQVLRSLLISPQLGSPQTKGSKAAPGSSCRSGPDEFAQSGITLRVLPLIVALIAGRWHCTRGMKRPWDVGALPRG